MPGGTPKSSPPSLVETKNRHFALLEKSVGQL